MQKSNLLNINRLDFQSVPRAGIEPARPLQAKGFSCYYGFRHTTALDAVFCSLDYSFTMENLFRCVVSSLCTFLFSEAWLKITISITC